MFARDTTVFDLKLGSVFEMRKTKKATEGEGFVANIDGYRVKIKYEDYFRAHSAFSALTPNKIVRAVIDGEVEELKLWCSGEEEFIDEVAEKVGRFSSSCVGRNTRVGTFPLPRAETRVFPRRPSLFFTTESAQARISVEER